MRKGRNKRNHIKVYRHERTTRNHSVSLGYIFMSKVKGGLSKNENK